MDEDAQTMPEMVRLEDGSWTQAPWMSWQGPPKNAWACYLCNQQGVCVTPDHLVCQKHMQRIDLVDGYARWYERRSELGQTIMEVWTHDLYRPRRQRAAARPAPPEPPAAPAGAPDALAIVPAPPREPPPGAASAAPPGLQAPIQHELLHPIHTELELLNQKMEATNQKVDAMTEQLETTRQGFDAANQKIDDMTEKLEEMKGLLNAIHEMFFAAPRGAATNAVRQMQ